MTLGAGHYPEKPEPRDIEDELKAFDHNIETIEQAITTLELGGKPNYQDVYEITIYFDFETLPLENYEIGEEMKVNAIENLESIKLKLQQKKEEL